MPRIGLRYRLQTDVHGLDLSRHRLLEDAGVLVVELDVHGAPSPQVIGSIMAAAAMGPTTRRKALRAIDAAIAQPGVIPEPFLVRRLLHGVPSERPPMAASGPVGPINGVILPDAAKWAGVPSERRWAMEVLGLGAEMKLDRTDIQKRFRRLLRTAHPDHGGESVGAAERIAELTEARELLLEGLAKTAKRSTAMPTRTRRSASRAEVGGAARSVGAPMFHLRRMRHSKAWLLPPRSKPTSSSRTSSRTSPRRSRCRSSSGESRRSSRRTTRP